MNDHRDFTDAERSRSPVKTSTFGSPFATPILLIDTDVDLGRGLLNLLTRYGFRADLAITADAALACVCVRYYRAMIMVADLSDRQHLFGLRQLRQVAPQTWMIVVATNTEVEACQVACSHGGDACLPKPFRFSDLLLRLESFWHLERAL